jgi:membrane protease YdiL (CAAX protease family)
MQYDGYGIASIFAMGLILGAARVKTGSTILAMLLHALANLVAMTETVIYLGGVAA